MALEPRPWAPLIGPDHDGYHRPDYPIEGYLLLQEGVEVLHLLEYDLDEEVDVAAGAVEDVDVGVLLYVIDD